MRRLVLAVTGASGAAYAVTVARQVLLAGCRLDLIVSPHGRVLLADEAGLADPAEIAAGLNLPADRLSVHDHRDLADALSSGSTATDGMAICPASVNTIGAVAAGLADNLITRAAAVHLKQRRRLVIVPREMPLSRIVLENLLRLDAAGAVVAPACPGFYHHPRSMQDVVDFVAAGVLNLLDVPHQLATRYTPPGDSSAGSSV